MKVKYDLIMQKFNVYKFLWLTSGIEGSYSSGEMDVAKQGFSTLPCRSSHHVLYQLPQRSGKKSSKVHEVIL
jgi:hypothetical protein